MLNPNPRSDISYQDIFKISKTRLRTGKSIGNVGGAKTRNCQCLLAFLKGVQRPAAFAIVCFCYCEFRTVSYSGSCAEQVVDFAQSMLVFLLPLITFPDVQGHPDEFFPDTLARMKQHLMSLQIPVPVLDNNSSSFYVAI